MPKCNLTLISKGTIKQHKVINISKREGIICRQFYLKGGKEHYATSSAPYTPQQLTP